MLKSNDLFGRRPPNLIKVVEENVNDNKEYEINKILGRRINFKYKYFILEYLIK